MFDRVLIGPFQSGLIRNVKQFMAPADAFTTLRNAYVFRDHVRKRFGAQYMGPDISGFGQLQSRLRILIDATDSDGNLTSFVGANIGAIGQMFSIGNALYTVTITVGDMLQTVATTTAQFNTVTGDFIFVGAPALTAVYYYPSLPVMGLPNYQKGPINNQPVIGFDTKYAYIYTNGWDRLGSGTLPVWHGADNQFFWSTNYQGINPGEVALLVSNYNATIGTPGPNDDPMWAYSDSFTPNSWINFSDYTRFDSNGSFVASARMIVSFKGLLVLISTIENDNGSPSSLNTEFPNRARYCAQGSPFAAGAWLQPNQTWMGARYTGGGFLDAATEERAIGCGFIKDRLIVEFERSTWELAYTGNYVLPLVWQRINSELGSESTFSTIPFDDQLLAIGSTGVHACSGTSVQRIDMKIPDEIYKINTSDNDVTRVYGIRDYYNECAYWTLISDNAAPTQTYPNRILLYNYRNDTWAYNDDSITCFGYYEQESDWTWESVGDLTWEDLGSSSWDSGVQQAQPRQIVAGNQQGYTFLLNADISRNAAVLQITDMTLDTDTMVVTMIVFNHNLTNNEYVLIENTQGVGELPNGVIKPITVIDSNTISIVNAADVFTEYTGGGTLTKVSQIDIYTKMINPYAEQDRGVFIQRVDFNVDRTENGQITVDYFPSSSELSMLEEGSLTGSLLGTGNLDTFPYPLIPLEAVQQYLWHPVYLQTSGQFIQLRFYLKDEQMQDNLIALSDFQLNAMVLYTRPTTMRL